jgi:hypothetical protein
MQKEKFDIILVDNYENDIQLRVGVFYSAEKTSRKTYNYS